MMKVEIRTVLDKEKKTGYRNQSVFGGLREYFQENILKSELVSQQDKIKIIKLAEMTEKYLALSLNKRSVYLEKMITYLEDIELTQSKREKEAQKGSIKNNLSKGLEILPGFGPKRIALLKTKNIESLEDLLSYYPYRHENRNAIVKVAEVKADQEVILAGTIIGSEFLKVRRNLEIIKYVMQDETGEITLMWYNQRGLKKILKNGRKVAVYGKVVQKYQQLQMNVQDLELSGNANLLQGMIPVYPALTGIPMKMIRNSLGYILKEYGGEIRETLPQEIIDRQKLVSRQEALQNIHFPVDVSQGDAAIYRLKFEEFFYFQCQTKILRQEKKQKGYTHLASPKIEAEFEKSLKFELTFSQKKAIKEIFADMAAPNIMNRLLHGDVGSGKTIVAVAAIYSAISSKHQAAFMAPTEVLAEQHYQKLKPLLNILGISFALLTGSMNMKERKTIYENVAQGKIDLLIGTHALIQDKVCFKKLGLAVIDEQHRFGVRQRDDLYKKGLKADVLVMSATPIPRTMMLSLYGYLDVSTLVELPQGRLPIETYAVSENYEKRVYEFVRKHLKAGRQGYFVCPLVEESEKIDLHAAEELAEKLEINVFPEFKIALVHGRMKSAEKSKIMQDFYKGEIDLLVSTTVIEVGIDVPNANIMVIRDAERFGLAQLHQLRGRVGRGEYASYCILIHNASNEEGKKRMAVMTRTNDGFEIGEEDLKLRGPGDVLGFRQHGLPKFKIGDVFEDHEVMLQASEEAEFFLQNGNQRDNKNFDLKENLRSRGYLN